MRVQRLVQHAIVGLAICRAVTAAAQIPQDAYLKYVPLEYPSPTTCWRRLQEWEEADLWLEIWRTFLAELDEKHRLDWRESFADASFAPAKKGALPSGPPAKARARNGWWWSTAKVFLWESTWLRPPPRNAR